MPQVVDGQGGTLKHHQLKKIALLTTLSSSLTCESAVEHHTAEQYSKTGRTKLQKRSHKERPIMKYLPGLSHDTKPLRCSTGNRAKVLLKGHPSIKRHPQYNKVSRLLQFHPESMGLTGDELCATWRLS